MLDATFIYIVIIATRYIHFHLLIIYIYLRTFPFARHIAYKISPRQPITPYAHFHFNVQALMVTTRLILQQVGIFLSLFIGLADKFIEERNTFTDCCFIVAVLIAYYIFDDLFVDMLRFYWCILSFIHWCSSLSIKLAHFSDYAQKYPLAACLSSQKHEIRHFIIYFGMTLMISLYIRFESYHRVSPSSLLTNIRCALLGQFNITHIIFSLLRDEDAFFLSFRGMIEINFKLAQCWSGIFINYCGWD